MSRSRPIPERGQEFEQGVAKGAGENTREGEGGSKTKQGRSDKRRAVRFAQGYCLYDNRQQRVYMWFSGLREDIQKGGTCKEAHEIVSLASMLCGLP